MPELLLPGNIISMDARAADRLTACGNGDAALLYLWLLRHGGQLDPDQAQKGLKWDGQRLEEASAALVNLGLSDGKAREEAAPIPAPQGPPDYTAADITREIEDATSTFPGLVNEGAVHLRSQEPVHPVRLFSPPRRGDLPAGELVRGGV